LTIPAFQTKSELVYQAVRGMIMHGEMKPGDRVVVGRIAKQLNVSDTPVREAIKQLVSDGFLEESVHVGAIVPIFTLEEVKETFHMRGALAALAVRLNASFYTPEVIERIDEILAQGAHYLAANDTDNFGAVNTLFHANLFATGHFKHLHNTYLGLMRKTDRFRAGFRGHVWNMMRSHAAHMEIRTEIVGGNFDRAAELIQKHEVESMRPLVEFLSSKEQ
jgi:DNA-binding GntR family transcriptional regulator